MYIRLEQQVYNRCVRHMSSSWAAQQKYVTACDCSVHAHTQQKQAGGDSYVQGPLELAKEAGSLKTIPAKPWSFTMSPGLERAKDLQLQHAKQPGRPVPVCGMDRRPGPRRACGSRQGCSIVPLPRMLGR